MNADDWESKKNTELGAEKWILCEKTVRDK